MAQAKKARPKRDPNKPTPKPAKKKSFIPKLIVGGAFVVLMVWVGLYSAQTGKLPWEWGKEDVQGFAEFSKEQVAEARERVEREVENVDWAALKDKITEKTQDLWNKVPELEDKLEAKIASLRSSRGAPTTGSSGSSASEPAEEGGSARRVDDGRSNPTRPPSSGDTEQPAAASVGSTEGEPPAPPPAAEPAEPSKLELGCNSLRDAMRAYRKSMNSQSQLKKAKRHFHEAREHLEAAHGEAGDAATRQEIEGYIMECNTYLEDCSKRETL